MDNTNTDSPAVRRLREQFADPHSHATDRLRALGAAEAELTERMNNFVEYLATTTFAEMRRVRRVAESLHASRRELNEARQQIGTSKRFRQVLTAPKDYAACQEEIAPCES